MFVKVFMNMKYVIVVVMKEDVDVCLKRPVTLNFTITDKVLMVMREVDIGLIPSSLPPIIYIILVYCCYFMSHRSQTSHIPPYYHG